MSDRVSEVEVTLDLDRLKHRNHPVTDLVLALADADIPEEIIDWDAVAEARAICDQPITEADGSETPLDNRVRYLGSTPNGEQFKP